MLEIRNLHTYYGTSHILHGVDFTVAPGGDHLDVQLPSNFEFLAPAPDELDTLLAEMVHRRQEER